MDKFSVTALCTTCVSAASRFVNSPVLEEESQIDSTHNEHTYKNSTKIEYSVCLHTCFYQRIPFLGL